MLQFPAPLSSGSTLGKPVHALNKSDSRLRESNSVFEELAPTPLYMHEEYDFLHSWHVELILFGTLDIIRYTMLKIVFVAERALRVDCLWGVNEKLKRASVSGVTSTTKLCTAGDSEKVLALPDNGIYRTWRIMAHIAHGGSWHIWHTADHGTYRTWRIMAICAPSLRESEFGNRRS